jgi:uncharacterized protein
MTWLQTASGRAFDLLHPDWRQVDFEIDVPEALARIARFTGHVRCGPYSVAQHCVIGADAIWLATKDREAAAAFLLHDAHEAYLGDIATPIVAALLARIDFFNTPGIGAMTAGKAVKSLKATLDKAIYKAAGMGDLGCPSIHARLVHAYDLRMLATERAHLLVAAPKPWAPAVEEALPLRMAGRITCWPWPDAADAYRERLRRYLPDSFAPRPSAPAPRPGFAARRATTRKPALTEA